MNSSEVTILFVEDDPADVELAKRAFRKAKIGNPTVFAKDGVQALEFLRGDGDTKQKVERPFVILTDLRMPRMDGIEFLKVLRDDPKLSDSIVFVLTTSDADRDRWEAYNEHVAGYILKDNVGKDFFRLIGMLDHYWKAVELPLERA